MQLICGYSFYFQTAVFYNVLHVRFPQRHCGLVCMPVAPDKRTDPGAFLLTSSRPNVFNARISEMGQRYLFPFVKKEMRLRTFARLFSKIDFPSENFAI